MKYTVLIIQMIQLVQTSYMILVIENHSLLRAVQFVMDRLIILDALKLLILKDTVSLLMIQHFVGPLEISVVQMVL
ncbi:MAG: hypothetical protein ACRD5E_06110 [Nitrososphaeraceae archaeon]